MLALANWLPLLLTAGAFFSLFAIFGRSSKFARVCAAILCIGLSGRYLYWRYTETIPETHGLLSTTWVWLFLTFETCSLLSSVLVQMFMSRHKDRSPIADSRQNSDLLQAPVDVFIATYNEGYDILERTIVGALAIQHSDLRVWVLDDGARSWVKELAEGLGAHYTYRVKGKDAKAGNVNHGLEEALKTGRRPQFLLLLDADFIPNRKILRRTLGLFEEQDVGIVQTPQHFFNPDPVQSNLFCSSVWPDEQRFFFNYLMPAKDAWGAAFCCGTSAVIRVDALLACGGMATETVTEDMLTTFRMHEYGYRTIYLNEPLSLGLAPEGLGEYLSQRSRWCLGAIQQLYTRWSFLGSAKLSLIQRISFLDGVLYWISGAFFRLLMLSCPLLYWLTGVSVIEATTTDLLYMLAPMILANLLFMGVVTRNRIIPLITDVTQLLSAFVICRTVAVGLFRPRGHAFKVTDKGISHDGRIIHWKMLSPFLILGLGTLVAMFFRLPLFNELNGTPGFSMNILWSIMNAFVLFTAAAACIEIPKRRLHERFSVDLPAKVLFENDQPLACTVENLSVGGAQLRLRAEWGGALDHGTLVLGGGELDVSFTLIRKKGSLVSIAFDTVPSTRRQLILKLFTGEFDNEVETISTFRVFSSIFKALFA